MSHYVLAVDEGILYACSDRCASDVFAVLAHSSTPMISMEWSTDDRDAFCASCTTPLGWRRRSALTLHKEMTPTARRLYQQVHERWWSDATAR